MHHEAAIAWRYPGDSSHGLTGWEHCFWLLFLGECCVFPFHALSLRFWIKVIKPPCTTATMLRRKLSPSTAYHSSNCGWTFFCWSSCPCQEARIPHTSWTPQWPIPISAGIAYTVMHWILSDELINFYFVSLGMGSFWPTTTEALRDNCASVFKMLHPSFDAANTHSGISKCTLKSHASIQCAWISSLMWNFITARCQNNIPLPAIFWHWNMTMWWRQATHISFWCPTTDQKSCRVSHITILPGIYS